MIQRYGRPGDGPGAARDGRRDRDQHSPFGRSDDPREPDNAAARRERADRAHTDRQRRIASYRAGMTIERIWAKYPDLGASELPGRVGYPGGYDPLAARQALERLTCDEFRTDAMRFSAGLTLRIASGVSDTALSEYIRRAAHELLRYAADSQGGTAA